MDCLLVRLCLRVAGLGDIVRAVLAFLLLIAALPARGQDLMQVPSGQVMLPYEALWEDHLSEGANGETWLILRFLAPEISKSKGRISFAEAEGDLVFLCTNIGLPLAAMTGGGVDQIIVTLLEKPLPRGQRDPDVTKFINAFRVTEGACIWE